MIALYTDRVCEFFVERLCSGLWSGSFSVFPPSHPYFSSFHCLISVTGAWNGGSWLGCGDLPAMGAVFYLGAGWPQRKPLGFQGTHLPLKRGSGLKVVFIQKKWLIRVCSHFQFDLHENPFSSGNSCKHDVPTCCPILRNSHLVSAKHSIVWSSTYRRRVCKMETLVLFSKSKF